MAQHPGTSGHLPQVKSKEQRHAERPTGMLQPGSEGQPSSPTIGTQISDRGFAKARGQSAHNQPIRGDKK